MIAATPDRLNGHADRPPADRPPAGGTDRLADVDHLALLLDRVGPAELAGAVEDLERQRDQLDRRLARLRRLRDVLSDAPEPAIAARPPATAPKPARARDPKAAFAGPVVHTTAEQVASLDRIRRKAARAIDDQGPLQPDALAAACHCSLRVMLEALMSDWFVAGPSGRSVTPACPESVLRDPPEPEPEDADDGEDAEDEVDPPEALQPKRYPGETREAHARAAAAYLAVHGCVKIGVLCKVCNIPLGSWYHVLALHPDWFQRSPEGYRITPTARNLLLEA